MTTQRIGNALGITGIVLLPVFILIIIIMSNIK